MNLHGRLREKEPLSNLLIRMGRGEKTEHLALPRRERGVFD
jgi:hypothetical protein